MGIKWPPPTKGKKKIESLAASESMVVENRDEGLFMNRRLLETQPFKNYLY